MVQLLSRAPVWRDRHHFLLQYSCLPHWRWCLQVHTCTYACTQTDRQTDTHTCTHTHSCSHTRAHTCTHTHTRTHTCTHTHTHTHTHTCTHTHARSVWWMHACKCTFSMPPSELNWPWPWPFMSTGFFVFYFRYTFFFFCFHSICSDWTVVVAQRVGQQVRRRSRAFLQKIRSRTQAHERAWLQVRSSPRHFHVDL